MQSQAVVAAGSISRHYGFNIVVRRWLATTIDIFFLLGLLVIVPNTILGDEVYGRTLFVWIGLTAGYYVILESLCGRTLGKLLLGIVVVTEHGFFPKLAQSIVRTLLRLIEVNPLLLGGIPAAIIVLSSRQKQRLGDMLARTFVLRVKDYRLLKKSNHVKSDVQPGQR